MPNKKNISHHRTQTHTKLPLLVFYDHHLTGTTYPTLLQLLPSLKRLGYDTVHYEPEFLSGTIDKELSSLRLLGFMGDTQAKNKRAFLSETQKTSFILKKNDLPDEILKEESKNFFRQYLAFSKDVYLQIDIIIQNNNGQTIFSELTGLLLQQGISQKQIMQTLNQYLAYFAAVKDCPFENEAIKFFNQRTRAMGQNCFNDFRDGKGVIVITGYRHPIHHDAIKKDIPYLAFYCAGSQNTHALQISNEKSPEEALNKKEVFFIESKTPEVDVLTYLKKHLPVEKQILLEPDYFELEEEPDCCSRLGCSIS